MYVKITNKFETHNGFEYRDGLNELLEPFNDDAFQSCVPGGLYFTNINHAHKYYSYGIYIRKINLPENDPEFKIIMDRTGDKWRANKIILGERYSLCNLETYKILNIKTPTINFMIKCAIKEDNINSLNTLGKIYLKNNPMIKLFCGKLCYGAALKKSYNIITWIKNEGLIDFDKIYIGAALGGNIDILQWAFDNNKYLSIDNKIDIINNAARRGHLDILKWVHVKKCSDDNKKKCSDDNKKKCSDDNKKKCSDDNKKKCSDDKLYMYAIRNNQYNVIKWAHTNNYIWERPNCMDVNKRTDERILKWLVRNGHFIDEVYTIIAPINPIIKNNIDLLNWSCKNEKIFKNAFNNEDVLLKICSHDKQIFNDIMDDKTIPIKIINKAASDGNLEMIKWMRKNGSCWDEYTCKNAARYDHFDCFKYLWLNNCHIDALTKLSEITNGDCAASHDNRTELWACYRGYVITYVAKTKYNYDIALNWTTTQIYLSNNIIAGFDVYITELGDYTFCIDFSRKLRCSVSL